MPTERTIHLATTAKQKWEPVAATAADVATGAVRDRVSALVRPSALQFTFCGASVKLPRMGRQPTPAEIHAAQDAKVTELRDRVLELLSEREMYGREMVLLLGTRRALLQKALDGLEADGLVQTRMAPPPQNGTGWIRRYYRLAKLRRDSGS